MRHDETQMPVVYDFCTFSVRRDRAGGLLLIRCADGRDAYFQPGDDAAMLEAQCEDIEALPLSSSNFLYAVSTLDEFLREASQ